jgi:hypothetical protein
VARGRLAGCNPTLTDDTGGAYAGSGCLTTGSGSSFIGVTSGYYWSGSTHDAGGLGAWNVILDIAGQEDGHAMGSRSKGDDMGVWPVRSGGR